MPGPLACLLAGATLLLSLVAGCSSASSATPCPGQYDPGRLSTAALRRENIGRIPEREATTRDYVSSAIVERRGWIERNYPGVVDVAVGDGWGVTYTRDRYGNISFHRARDHLILATVESRKDCPDPDRGTLLIFGTEGGHRVPVRFVYRST